MSEDKSSAGEWLAGIVPDRVARVLRDDVRAPSMVARIDTCAEGPAEMLLRFLAERDQMLAELRAKLAERDKRAVHQFSLSKGEGLALDLDQINRAVALAKLFPSDFDLPEVGVTPAGSITLNWIGPNDEMFVVLVESTGKLGYVVESLEYRSHGNCAFEIGSLPTKIVEEIDAWRRITSNRSGA